MRDRAYIVWVGFVLLVVWAGSAGAQDEQWLQYRSAREASTIVGGLTTITLPTRATSPAGVELPELTDEEPVFAKWATPMVESGGLWIALVHTSASTLPDSLYIDSNGDGRLSDETPVSAYRVDQYNRYFGPVKVVFQIADGPVTYHLNLRYYQAGGTPRLYVSAGGWYEGDITVGGIRKHCTLLDYNANGAFDDQSSAPAQSDRIAISTDTGAEPMFLGKYVNVDGTLCELEVARDGAFVKLAEAESVTYGTVHTPECISAVTVGGENGQFVLNPENGSIRLPVGAYRVTAWMVERKDDNGAQWRLTATSSSKATAIDVCEKTAVGLQIGEPIVAALSASEKDGTYNFSQNLQGLCGERVTLTRNGAQPQAPRLNIRNEDGTYDRTFSFSYG